MAVLAGVDLFTIEVLTWRGLATYYVLFFLHLERYHTDRNHQGKGNVLLFPSVKMSQAAAGSIIRRRKRLGGLLNHYSRAA